ncbi:hypothetical protein L798_03489 [Zootermopsis nevadensis]|uniref:Uncharacterized protein n=1 Tax=Zootermopsis nevadensis TaxID=136037 RepID=A0A067QFJ6_ZOONE|nr:hypothetical protein L798_03489 [Zootermopsis nevadensis]
MQLRQRITFSSGIHCLRPALKHGHCKFLTVHPIIWRNALLHLQLVSTQKRFDNTRCYVERAISNSLVADRIDLREVRAKTLRIFSTHVDTRTFPARNNSGLLLRHHIEPVHHISFR